MAEDDKNIEELLDYKDFESNLAESEKEKDSFQNNIEKIYEDHKRSQGFSEVQNPTRPISSYQRVLSANSRSEDPPMSPSSLIQRLNSHIGKNKISEREFLNRNEDIYLDLNEFKNLFKQIGFELTGTELNFLFMTNNQSSKDGFLLGKSFSRNFPQVRFAERPVSTIGLISSSDQNKDNLTYGEKLEKFKNLESEIFSIIENDRARTANQRNPKTAKPKSVAKIRVQSNRTQQGQGRTARNKQPSGIFSSKERSSSANFKSIRTTTKRTAHEFLIETLRKKRAEEELVKLAIEKRNKEFERDCIQKMFEANKYAKELEMPFSYTVHMSDDVMIFTLE